SGRASRGSPIGWPTSDMIGKTIPHYDSHVLHPNVPEMLRPLGLVDAGTFGGCFGTRSYSSRKASSGSIRITRAAGADVAATVASRSTAIVNRKDIRSNV